MYATVRLSVLLSVVALAVATPYYLPQQRQLFYPLVPQYQVPLPAQYHASQYQAPVAPLPYRHFYYPQASANLISPVPALRYPSPLVHPAKQVVYYPGMPYPMVLAGDEGAEASGGDSWSSWISSFSNYFPFGPSESPSEEAASAEGPAAGAASPDGQKVENSEKPAKGDMEKEEAKPAEENKVKAVPQNFGPFNQPQFFGNFGLQRINPAMILPSAQNGAVSSYLLLKNIPGVRFAAPVPQVPQSADATPTSDEKPGQAALDYQKLLQQAQADRQQKDFDDASVTVDAEQKDATAEDAEKPVAETEADEIKENDDEESGTSE